MEQLRLDLNTSHVKVNRKSFITLLLSLSYLNTSHVKVNQRKKSNIL